MAITNTPNLNGNVTATNTAPTNNPTTANNGIKAKGVGKFQKTFLWLSNRATGWVGKKHDSQLGKLSQQVRNECGDRGLTILNKKLDDHNWTARNKMFSGKELNTLRSEVHTTLNENDRLALEHTETILNQRVALKTTELFDKIFVGGTEGDHSEALQEFPEIAQKLQEFKSFAATSVKESVAREMASEKEQRCLDKFNEILNDLVDDVTKPSQYPEVAQYLNDIKNNGATTEGFDFLNAVNPYCTGAIQAGPQEVEKLLSIVENFIDDRDYNPFAEDAKSLINLDTPERAAAKEAYDELRAAQNGSDAEKTQAAQKLIDSLHDPRASIQNMVVQDKFQNMAARQELRAIATTIVEREILVENRQALGLD